MIVNVILNGLETVGILSYMSIADDGKEQRCI
jgi:hypothetical protein